jgi:ribosomal protein S18 acetylase RimI-like enzyme
MVVPELTIRSAKATDGEALWRILEPHIRAGETFAMPRDWSREQALTYWVASGHHVFVAKINGEVLGSYYLRANQLGPGDHVANAGYAVAPEASGRGIAQAMCLHSLDEAKRRGFAAMQFNIVVSSNTRAVALWQSCGFAIVGTVPGAFRHPVHGPVDTYVMWRTL